MTDLVARVGFAFKFGYYVKDSVFAITTFLPVNLLLARFHHLNLSFVYNL
jgi:hypothetical protein